jgi:hypothetical protein
MLLHSFTLSPHPHFPLLSYSLCQLFCYSDGMLSNQELSGFITMRDGVDFIPISKRDFYLLN